MWYVIMKDAYTNIWKSEKFPRWSWIIDNKEGRAFEEDEYTKGPKMDF